METLCFVLKKLFSLVKFFKDSRKRKRIGSLSESCVYCCDAVLSLVFIRDISISISILSVHKRKHKSAYV